MQTQNISLKDLWVLQIYQIYLWFFSFVCFLFCLSVHECSLYWVLLVDIKSVLAHLSCSTQRTKVNRSKERKKQFEAAIKIIKRTWYALRFIMQTPSTECNQHDRRHSRGQFRKFAIKVIEWIRDSVAFGRNEVLFSSFVCWFSWRFSVLFVCIRVFKCTYSTDCEDDSLRLAVVLAQWEIHWFVHGTLNNIQSNTI